MRLETVSTTKDALFGENITIKHKLENVEAELARAQASYQRAITDAEKLQMEWNALHAGDASARHRVRFYSILFEIVS